MKNNKLFYGFNTDIAMKLALAVISWVLAIMLSPDSKKAKRKKSTVAGRTKKINKTLCSLADTVYLNKLKKSISAEDSHIKVENAEIIEI